MDHAESRSPALAPDVQREIMRAVAGVEFGSVEVIVHNGRVVQIEVRTKKRFEGEGRTPR
jgi:hypothetical protein